MTRKGSRAAGVPLLLTLLACAVSEQYNRSIAVNLDHLKRIIRILVVHLNLGALS
jgi:hypothetical protein